MVSLVLALASAHAGAEPELVRPPAHASLPWLFNVDDVIAVSSETQGAMLPLDLAGELSEGCPASAYGSLLLHADAGPPAGRETLIASYAGGIKVLGAEGALVATTPGYPCLGSADDLEVLATGRVFGAPTVFAAITTGGRREQITWVSLFRVGHGGRLEALFSGTVEQREDGIVRHGSITLLPGGLLHRDPAGYTVFWVFDAAAGVYVPLGSTDGPEPGHV